MLSELKGARLDPTTLALARRLDDPLAAHRLAALQGKTRAELTEGLDLAEAKAVAEAARSAVPGPLAPAAERVAMARYQQTGDQDDAVALARDIVGKDALAGGDGEDDLAESESGDGITFGPEDVEDGGGPTDLTPLERFEVQGPDGTAFTVTRTEDGDLLFDNPVTGEAGALPKTLVTMIEMGSAGDPVMRDLAMQIAVLSSLADGLPDDGSGTRKAVQAASRERVHALVAEALGPTDGPNRMVVANLHAAFEQSLRATNVADRQRAIEREAFPAFHDGKVKGRTDELAGTAGLRTLHLAQLERGEAEDDPARREPVMGVSVEPQKELGIPENDRRVLTQQGLADLTAQIESVPTSCRESGRKTSCDPSAQATEP